MFLSKLLMLCFSFFILIACQSSRNDEAEKYFLQGNYQAAIEIYNQKLATQPKDVNALFNRGRAYEELGELDSAEKSMAKALEYDSRNLQVLMSLSNLYQKQKNHNKALMYADQAVELPGAPALAYFLKGRALHQLGKPNEALKEYSTAIKLDDDFARAYYYRGMLKVATNKRKSACEDLKMAERLKFEKATNAIAQYCS
jgi:tetratricopeptide (TPR) repeat protein